MTSGPPHPGSVPDFPPAPGAHTGPTPDEIIDAFFDRELDPARSRDFLAGLKNDHARSEEVARTQRMVSLLRRTPLQREGAEEALAEAIMARVGRRRAFLPPAWRRLVTAGRLAAAAAVLLAGFGAAVLGRVHPDLLRLAPQQASIGTLLESGRSEAASNAAQYRVTLETISDRAAAPLLRLRARAVAARDGAPIGSPAQRLYAGAGTVVRLSDGNADGLIERGSGEPSSGAMGASFAMGLELVCARQRSGASAPVFVPSMMAARAAGTGQVRPVSASNPGGTPAVASSTAALACRSISVGDHTVLLPAGPDLNGGAAGTDGGPSLLIQAMPPGPLPPR